MDELKERLAQCCRMLEMLELIDHSGHVSARIKGTDRILIHPRHISRIEVSAKDLITVNLDGKLIEGEEEPPSETPLHTSIYKVRDDVMAVAHLHTDYATLFSIAGKPILPVSAPGAIFADGVPVYPDSGHINTKEKGDEVARTLGNRKAILLKAHGAVVVSVSVEGVFSTAIKFEENAKKQYKATLLGEPIPLSPKEIENYLKITHTPRGFKKVWDYNISMARRRGIV